MNKAFLAISMLLSVVAGMHIERNYNVGIISNSKSEILCQYSKYATSDFKIIMDEVYCRESINGYQRLIKPTKKEFKQ